MHTNLITCPSCGHSFSLSDVQKHEMEEMRRSLEKKLQTEIEADMKKRAFSWAQEEVKKAKIEAQELTDKIQRENEESAKKQSIELESLRKRDEEARKKEQEFLQKENEFEMLKKNIEIEKEKAKIEERKRLEEEFSKQAQEKVAIEIEKQQLETEKRLRAKDEQIAQMARSIEDAKRKSEQGSMQIQGELQEDALKELLTVNFPFDIISDVEK